MKKISKLIFILTIILTTTLTACENLKDFIPSVNGPNNDQTEQTPNPTPEPNPTPTPEPTPDDHVHNYSNCYYTIEPSCTEYGLERKECSCGDFEEILIYPLGHIEKIIAGNPATCESSGLTDGIECERCGLTLESQIEIEKLEHNYTTTTIAPTKNSKGYDLNECLCCGETLKDNFVPALIYVAPNDTTAPILESFTLDKTTVNVGDIITFTAVVTDESSIYNVEFMYECGAIVEGVRMECQENDTFIGQLEITEKFINGTYDFQWFSIEDYAGNYNSEEPVATFTVINPYTDIIVAPNDTTAPVLESFTLDKTTVTVGDIITFTAVVTDESSIYNVEFMYECGAIVEGVRMECQENDTFIGQLEITERFINGTYDFQWFSIEDYAGNYNSEEPVATFTVINPYTDIIVAPNDTTAPVLVSFTLDKTNVNVGDVITFTAVVSDESSIYNVEFMYECGAIVEGVRMEHFEGNTFIGQLEITDRFINGTYDFQWFSIEDYAGNYNSEEPVATFTVGIVEEHTHNFGSWHTTNNPTCTDNGQEQRECSCGKVEIREVAPLGHTECLLVGTSPTCSTEGLTEGVYCIRCNETLVEQETIDKLEHEWEDIIADPEPTCTEIGYMFSVCINCNANKTEAMEPMGHNYVTITIAPTKDSSGYDFHECFNCGDTYTDNYVPALENGTTNETNIPGIISFTSDKSSVTFGETITFTIVVEDYINVYRIALMIKCGAFEAHILPTSIGNNTYIGKYEITEEYFNGTYMVSILQVIDYNGEIISESPSNTFTVTNPYSNIYVSPADTTEPEIISCSFDKTNVTVGDTVTFTTVTTDESGIYRVALIIKCGAFSQHILLNNIGNNTYAGEYIITDEYFNGIYVIETLQVIDYAGNITSTNPTNTITVTNPYSDVYISPNDTTGPTVISCSFNKTNVTVGDTIKFTAVVTDHSGIHRIALQIKCGAFTNHILLDSIGNSTYSGEFIITEDFFKGTYVIDIFQIVDYAGNITHANPTNTFTVTK